jgi:mono/diheme cytochrome c family protein
MKKIIGTVFVSFLAMFGLLQLVHPRIPERPSSAEVQAPPQVMQVLQKSCYDCHSDQTQLSWFDQVEPGYWLVRHDVLAARERL